MVESELDDVYIKEIKNELYNNIKNIKKDYDKVFANISLKIEKDKEINADFKKLLYYLQEIKEDITSNDVITMISQHIIIRDSFEILFKNENILRNNVLINKIESLLKKTDLIKNEYTIIKNISDKLIKIKNKQKVIIIFYETLLKATVKKDSERLGVVFTPIEVVDFIVKSVDDVLKKHFGKSLASEGVHILDPFTGTGTFIVRTLTYLQEQMNNGEITLADITRKFTQELHANEIILLSYYIAAINIESTFDEIDGDEQGYVPFEGIVLTDTFESTEGENTLDDIYFGTNDKRLKRQQEEPITVIIGNPPYSAKQKNEDKNQRKSSYPILDESLKKSWVETSTAKNKNNLFDSYIRAIRWSSNRIQSNGVIGFITNNSFIDGNAMDGMRKSLLNEFTDIYILNLKGAIRGKTKAQSIIEGGNIFNIMTGVTIVLFMKDNSSNQKGTLHYLDIGDELSKTEKLSILKNWQSLKNIETEFEAIIPNEKGDWINQRKSDFDSLITLGNKKNDDALFIDYTGGIKTGRDDWSWAFMCMALTRLQVSHLAT